MSTSISLEPRPSIPYFVSQLFSKAARQIQNVKLRFNTQIYHGDGVSYISCYVCCFMISRGLTPQEKHDRMKRFKRLTEMETAMCETVGEESRLGPQWQAQIVPSEEDLKSFRKRIEEVEEIKVSLSLLHDGGRVV